MNKQVVVIYDDSRKASKYICDITGGKSFGNIIYKRKTLKERAVEEINKKEYVYLTIGFEPEDTAAGLIDRIAGLPEDIRIVHLLSSFGIRDQELFGNLLDKLQFLNEPLTVTCNDKCSIAMFPSKAAYLELLDTLPETAAEIPDARFQNYQLLETQAFADISDSDQFMAFITGGFDARFFNSLHGDEFFVTKQSTNREKIEREYRFYHLLPEAMKHWFVLPFDFKDNGESACYTMERYHMPDIAIRWVHQAIDSDEFRKILNKLFYFIGRRETKEVPAEAYEAVVNELYIEKIEKRYQELKENPVYPVFDDYISRGTKYNSISEVFEEYKNIYSKIRKKHKTEPILTVGHGDLCFSNILYSKDLGLMKFIDPKGALQPEELWTDPYYDLAKLSHSICGNYDLFNSGLYVINIEEDMQVKLKMDIDTSAYRLMFRRILEDNGYIYELVRLYEASLFLSMLPLHMDNPQKVFAFLLNSIQILDELKG